jgi:hypothetical protein
MICELSSCWLDSLLYLWKTDSFLTATLAELMLAFFWKLCCEFCGEYNLREDLRDKFGLGNWSEGASWIDALTIPENSSWVS